MYIILTVYIASSMIDKTSPRDTKKKFYTYIIMHSNYHTSEDNVF